MKDDPARVDGTAWWDQEKVTAQLREAVATWERHYVQQPVQRDFFAHAENVSAWIAMTSAHSLVEQALKAVLRKEGRLRLSYVELQGTTWAPCTRRCRPGTNGPPSRSCWLSRGVTAECPGEESLSF